MNKTLLITLLFFGGIVRAQEPQPIYGFAVQMKPLPWYKEQAALWKKEVDKDPHNANAWYNYFRVSRNLSRLDTTDTRTADERSKVLAGIVNEIEKNVPGSYEYNLTKWMTGGNDFEKNLPYLKKAAELGKDKTTHYSEMMNWAEVDRNTGMKTEYARKWLDSRDASPGLLSYNYNVLAGLKPNAIIVTAGDNDTYPIWILQGAQDLRKDVTAINTSMVRIKEYRARVFKELGVKDLPYSMDDGKTDPDKMNKDLLEALISNSQGRPVYIALTVSPEHYKSVEGQLYLTGLAYEYSRENLDNMASLRKNFEQAYILDYIDKGFAKDISEYWVQTHFNYNYLVLMMKLYDHYQLSGETMKAQKMAEKISYIVRGRQEEKEVMAHLGKKK